MKAVTILFGVLLLLPGLCSVLSGVFVVPALISSIFSGYGFDGGTGVGFIWLAGLGLGVIGIWIIRNALSK